MTGPVAVRRARFVAGTLAVLWGGLPAEPPSSPPRVIAYLASWSVRAKGLRIVEIPGHRLSHIFYAFGRVAPDGRAALGDAAQDSANFADLRALKARFSHLRVLISLGGWGGSRYFSDAAASDTARRALVQSTLDLFLRGFPGVFDGVDLDWEFPVTGGLPENSYRPEDKRNYTLLVEEFRRQLDEWARRTSRRYELTIAASARPWEIANLELPALARYLDWINVMTYDYHSVDTVAAFNAPLYAATGDPAPALNIDSSLRIFRDAGVPASRLALGIPFYGRGYGGVEPDQSGLFQKADYASAREWGAGGIDYRVLAAKEPERHGFTRYWHAEAKVPWLYNAAARVWISYDDSISVRLKVEYAHDHGLGGVMFWELGCDDGTLLRAVHEGLTRRESRR